MQHNVEEISRRRWVFYIYFLYNAHSEHFGQSSILHLCPGFFNFLACKCVFIYCRRITSCWQNIFNEKCRNSSWMHQVNGSLFVRRGRSHCAVIWCKPACKVGIFGNVLCDCSGSLWVLYQFFLLTSSRKVPPSGQGCFNGQQVETCFFRAIWSSCVNPMKLHPELWEEQFPYLCAIGSLSPWGMMSWGPLLRARPRILEL